ncbi:hypothetical protein P9112_008930 [Eukaryota sp. TZLM1-RC]
MFSPQPRGCRYGAIEDPGVIHHLIHRKSRISNITIVASRICALAYTAFLLSVFINKLFTIHQRSVHEIIDNLVILVFAFFSTGVLFRHVGVGCLLFLCVGMYGLGSSIPGLLKMRTESEFWFITVGFSVFFLFIVPLSTSILAFATFRLRRHITYLRGAYLQLEFPEETASEFE